MPVIKHYTKYFGVKAGFVSEITGTLEVSVLYLNYIHAIFNKPIRVKTEWRISGPMTVLVGHTPSLHRNIYVCGQTNARNYFSIYFQATDQKV